jgi:exodeoxyribonuclease VII large subunit
MARSSKSQWEFGELFPKEAVRPVWSVTDLTARVKRQFEKDFSDIRVSGEISNYRLQASGHAYFVLKDAGAQLNCVLFRGQAGVGRTLLKDGIQATLGGEITVYEPRGQYQLRVTEVELQGVGALQAAFERLKVKLQAEGLFAAERKRAIPKYPATVGLITSPTGAAIQDVLHVIQRRFSPFSILFIPCRVQGNGAAEEIAAAIRQLNEWSKNKHAIDVLLLTRGGGSLEDLWCFNDEMLARTIAASAIPVVSAVGHEIDFTIADFVADHRAATPSVAAEFLTQYYILAGESLASMSIRMRSLLGRRFEYEAEKLEGWCRRLARVHPRRQLEARSQHLDDLTGAMISAARESLRSDRQNYSGLFRRLVSIRPRNRWEHHRRDFADIARRFPSSVKAALALKQTDLRQIGEKLILLSPLSVLNRGYSITSDAKSGKVLRNADSVEVGSQLRTQLAGGYIESVVKSSSIAPGAGRD